MTDTTNVNRYAPVYSQATSRGAPAGMRHFWMPNPDGIEFGTAAHRAAKWLLNWFDNGMRDDGYALNNVELSQKLKHAAHDEGWTLPKDWWPSVMAPFAVRILRDSGNERVVPSRVWSAITESVGLGNLPASQPEPSLLQRSALARDRARNDAAPHRSSHEQGSPANRPAGRTARR